MRGLGRSGPMARRSNWLTPRVLLSNAGWQARYYTKLQCDMAKIVRAWNFSGSLRSSTQQRAPTFGGPFRPVILYANPVQPSFWGRWYSDARFEIFVPQSDVAPAPCGSPARTAASR